jgi:hypothetical protein
MRNKTLQWRNRQIYAEFIAHLRNGQPIMMAYTIVAENYGVDADYVRAIIREQAKIQRSD